MYNGCSFMMWLHIVHKLAKRDSLAHLASCHSINDGLRALLDSCLVYLIIALTVPLHNLQSSTETRTSDQAGLVIVV